MITGREEEEIAIGINFCNEGPVDTPSEASIIHNKKRKEKKNSDDSE